MNAWRDSGNFNNLKCWQGEAYRRFVAFKTQDIYSDFRYNTEEKLWFWSDKMIEELIMLVQKSKNIEVCEWDIDGPGIGIHFFNRLALDGKPTGLIGADDINKEHLIRLVKITKEASIVSAVELIDKGKYHKFDLFYTEENEKERKRPNSITNLLIAMQALLKSKVIEIDEVKADRAFRRRAKKQGQRMEHEVRVLKWRKVYAQSKSTGDTRKIGEDKHWWIKGHIRNQWYPKKGKHHAKYIFPHIKGNRNAPLHVSVPMVNHVVR